VSEIRGTCRIRGLVRRRAVRLAATLASVSLFVGALPAAVHAASPSGAVSWLTYGFNDQRTGYNPSETTIGVGNASSLHALWSVDLGDVMIAQPVEAAAVSVAGVPTDVVYEGTEHGDLYAIRASDGQPVWHKNLGSVQTTCYNMPDGVYGIGGAGAIAFTGPGTGVIYVAGGDGSVHALDLATGSERPGWPVTGVFTPAQEHVWSAVNLLAGKLYVTVASHCDSAPYYGDTVEIDVHQHAIVHRFYPAGPPSGGISGGGIWGYGGAAIDPSNRHVFVATGNALTTPDNYLYSDAVVELSRSLKVLGSNSPILSGNDVDFGATPILFRPTGCPVTLVAAKNKHGLLVVYAEGDLAGGDRQQLQIASGTDWRFNGNPAWDPVTNMLYVSNSTDSSSGPYLHGMVALKAASDCSLSLAWQQSVGPTFTSVSSPTAANGVVYYGDGRGSQEFAFDAATGNQLWSSGSATGQLFAAPTVANGELFVASWDHHLYAFGP
jgi:outer membrane protein assembly factor BamB